MKAFRSNTIYKHDGQTLSPKLVYGLPDEMAHDMAALGFGQVVTDPVDISLEGINWDRATKRAGDVSPDPITHPQGIEG